MVTNVLEVNPERLWQSLERSAEIGRFRDVGLRRLALSSEDKEMRDLFIEWTHAAGCTVEIDRLGNIFARRAGSDPSLPPVAIGSHLDTQICGGRYDGILGVLCGLEVVRTLNDRGLATKRGIEVICWTNEEGARFSPPMMGSMAFAKVLTLDNVLATTDDSGITVAEALDEIGYAGPAPLGERKFDCYLEQHIEQAPVLDREGCDVGIVVGGYKTQALRLTINGDTGHAGGTPMAMRRNALVGAGYVIAAINDIGLAYAVDEGRTTTTRIESFPNLPGTYAEQVKLTIDFRHVDAMRFQAMRRDVDAAIAASAKKASVEIEVAEGWSWGTELFAPECIELLKTTARELGLPYRDAEPGRPRCLCRRHHGADGDDLHALLRGHQPQRQRGDRAQPVVARRQPAAERGGGKGKSIEQLPPQRRWGGVGVFADGGVMGVGVGAHDPSVAV